MGVTQMLSGQPEQADKQEEDDQGGEKEEACSLHG